MAELGSIQNKMTQWNSVQSLIIWTEFHWVILLCILPTSTMMWNRLYCHRSVSAFFSIITIYRISIWTECSNPFSQIGNIPGTFSYTKSSMLLCPFLGSIKCEIPAILKRIFMIILCRLQTVHKYLRRKNLTFK